MPMKRQFKNCSECVALKHCFSDAELTAWDNSKNMAEKCTKPYRGYGNDLVQVQNSAKCLSLKKAFRLARDGRIHWEDYHQARYPEKNMRSLEDQTA